MKIKKLTRIAIVKYSLSASLFALMMIFTSATVNISKAANVHTKMPCDITNMPVTGRVAATDTVPDNRVFVQVETMPQFPGGMMDFFNFLANNTHYPAIDRQNNVTGKVIVQFVVEKDGSLTAIKALRGPSPTLMSEAIRVMGTSPKWKPGIQNGHVVRVMYTVPINFTLNMPKTLPAANAPGSSSAGTADDNRIYAQVDAQPEFPGGLREFSSFLAKNIHYPDADKASKTEGKVYIQFVVEKDGSISGIRTLRGPSEAMMNEAIRVMSVSPKWKPGIQNNRPVRVMFTVPINFTLQKAGPTGAISDTVINGTRVGKTIITGYSLYRNGESPVYVIDGVVKDRNSFDQLDPNAIESFSVLKNASAEVYGTQAIYGVILVTTKNLKKPADKKTTN